MKKPLIFEPTILGIGTFLLYVSGLILYFIMAAVANCPLKGSCDISPFLVLVIAHWIAVGFVLKRSLTIAKWLMVLFGTLPLLGLSYQGLTHKLMNPIFWITEVYLFIFCGLFTAYLWLSSEVKRYLQNIKAGN